MALVKILKRKDAFSVIIAILIAMIVSQVLLTTTGRWASVISGIDEGNSAYGFGPGGGWKNEYEFPIVWVLVQLVVLELLCWLAIGLDKVLKKGRKKKV